MVDAAGGLVLTADVGNLEVYRRRAVNPELIDGRP